MRVLYSISSRRIYPGYSYGAETAPLKILWSKRQAQDHASFMGWDLGAHTAVDLHDSQGLKRDYGQKCWVEKGLSKADSLYCPSSKAVRDLPVLIQSSVLGLNVFYLGT